MKSKKSFGGMPDSQKSQALRGIKIEPLTEQVKSAEEFSKPEESYEESLKELFANLKDRQFRYEVLQKIESYLREQSEKESVRFDDLLKGLRGKHLLKQSGVSKELQKRIEQSDYQEAYRDVSKLIDALKKEISEKIPQFYDKNKKDAGFVYKMFENYEIKMEQSATKLVNPIASAKMQSFFEDIFAKGGLASNALLAYLKKETKLNAEDLQSWLAGFLDYYQEVVLENLANLKESFNAGIVKTKQLTDETVAAKMANKHFDLKLNLASLEGLLRKSNATDLQKDYLSLKAFLKAEHYFDVLTDKDVKQDFVETLDKGKQGQQELMKKLGNIKNAVEGRFYDKTTKRFEIDNNLLKWMKGETSVPPSLDFQARFNRSLMDLLHLHSKFFEKKFDEIIKDFRQEMKVNSENFKTEKSDFERFVILWNKHRSAEKLATFSLSEQKEMMEFLMNRDWLALIDKFSLFSLMEKEKLETQKVVEKKSVIKPESEVTIEKGKKEKPLVEVKDVSKDVFRLLKEMEASDSKYQDTLQHTQKSFVLLGDQLLVNVKKDKESFGWDDALDIMDGNDKAFFKGLLNHLLDLPHRIADLDEKFGDGVLDDEVLDNLEEKYNQALNGLFKYEVDKKRLTFDGQVRSKINKMNSLYFNKLFKLLNRDLENIPKSKLSVLVNGDGSINEEILTEVLASTKFVSKFVEPERKE